MDKIDVVFTTMIIGVRFILETFETSCCFFIQGTYYYKTYLGN